MRENPISKMFDFEKNTPLHLASLNDNEDATVKLLTDYQCSIDVRNQNGIMAKDVGFWHDKIHRVYADFYSEFDKAMGVMTGVDEDEKYSEAIANSFKNQ